VKQVSLKIVNITKIFKDFKNNEIRAVDNISFEIIPGEFVTLLGPSGCGKTTTLRMIAGFEKPTEGKIFINDINVVEIPPWKRDIAMVFQSYGLFPHMSVGENIAYGLKMRKIQKEESQKKVKEILRIVGLEGFEDRPPSSLSGGQQQRIALARALVIEPSVLLFDEPLSNLDALLREQMRIEIKRIQKEVGITAIYVTHDRTEALTLSDKIVLMKDGKIEQIGNPEDVYEKPVNKFVGEFMGKIFFFPIQVLDILEKETLVRLKDRVYKIPSLPTDKADNYVLGCRTEALKISSDGPIEGKIKTIVYLGESSEYYIDTEYGEIMIRVLSPFDKNLSEGKSVKIDLVPEIAKIIPD